MLNREKKDTVKSFMKKHKQNDWF